MFNHICYSIDHSKPLIFNIKPDRQLENYKTYSGNMGGHYIIGRGYYWGQSGQYGTAQVYYSDPHYSTPYGRYKESCSKIYDVIRNNSGYIVNAQ